MEEFVILVVDDDPDDRALTMRALDKAKNGYRVVGAADGVEALDLLWGRAGKAKVVPALILLDLNMPRLGGLEVLRALRADPATWLLPVIVLTSSKEDQEKFGSYNLGANTFIPKPVDVVDLELAVEQLGLFSRMGVAAPNWKAKP